MQQSDGFLNLFKLFIGNPLLKLHLDYTLFSFLFYFSSTVKHFVIGHYTSYQKLRQTDISV